jgi:hypothetical protein
MCRSSAVCFGSGLVPNKGLEFWNTVPPGRMASLTLAERSIGLPTTAKSVPAYAEASETSRRICYHWASFRRTPAERHILIASKFKTKINR